MDVGNLSRDTADTTVEWGGEEMSVTYKPGLLTPKRIDAMGEQDYGLQTFICEVVSKWDLTETKKVGGKTKDVMFPIELERVKELPTPFLRKIMRAMLMAGSEVGEAESNSSDGSSPKAN